MDASLPETKHTSYFDTKPTVPEVSTYDRVFHQAEGYDMRLHRDDRRHFKGRGLDINEEMVSQTCWKSQGPTVQECGENDHTEAFWVKLSNATCVSSSTALIMAT
ncbi:cilia- and flagella-associated protein 90 isoform 2-T2 [Spinachia spinachia]